MTAKLVVIGDSLSQGFQSGSIYNTDISYPTMIAKCLGATDFSYPQFGKGDKKPSKSELKEFALWELFTSAFKVNDDEFLSGYGGLPINLEYVVRLIEKRAGSRIQYTELFDVASELISFFRGLEDYWERGKGLSATPENDIYHNLAVWGFTVDDSFILNEKTCRDETRWSIDDRMGIPEYAMYITARRTLNRSYEPKYETMSQLQLAQTLAEDQNGIENLIYWHGANNCLGTVTSLTIHPTEEQYVGKPAHKNPCNIWRPEHFERQYKNAVQELKKVKAKNIFLATVPHVTIPPVTRGISPDKPVGQERDEQGYYDYYTHFWVWDDDFKEKLKKDSPDLRFLTKQDAKAIDRTIDAYNQVIRTAAFTNGWHLVDICQVLDDLAFRRSGGNVSYTFPDELIRAMKEHQVICQRFDLDNNVVLDTRYLRLRPHKKGYARYQGGIFSLDGFHPTTIGYGLVAHEFLKVMKSADVRMEHDLDWKYIVEHDSLMSKTPPILENLRFLLGSLEKSGTLTRFMSTFSLYRDDD